MKESEREKRWWICICVRHTTRADCVCALLRRPSPVPPVRSLLGPAACRWHPSLLSQRPSALRLAAGGKVPP